MKTSKLRAMLATLALGFSFAAPLQAQDADNLPNYVPVLPQVKSRALAVDPQKGYLVKQVKPDVYVITDGIYQSAFVTTGKGVILFDAPESFGQHIVKAVAEVTREPIVQLVYSHAHLDHIAGASLLVKQAPQLRIVAEAATAAFLREKQDPRRPLPTSTFKNRHTLKLGTMTVELEKGHWHSPEGDLMIYLPGRKFLMAIDTLAAGHVPFMDFDLSTNMHAYLKVFDQLLAYDFDVLVPGHLTYLADRQDVQMTKDYALDVYKTVKRIHDGTDQMKVMSQAAQKYSWDNKFAIFRTLLDGVVAQCASEIQGRWIDKLAGVDVFGPSHCRAALIYARWDD
jgi:glyoxylase-like metal-dependent hydrolase (beta-lactamase superfamily II)